MSIDIGIALLPDEATKQVAVRLSRALQQRHQTSYSLGDVYHPHMTLYQATFPGYETLKSFLGNLHPDISAMRINAKGLVITPNNYIFVSYQKNPMLEALQIDVIKAVSGKRLKAIPTIWERNKIRLPPAKERAVELYGFPEAFDEFEPHMTIGRVLDDIPKSEDLLAYLRNYFEEIPFVPSSIVYYELGADGGCLNPKPL
ncbi:MAG: DUF1045 domain-containing protein [Candidatus Aenigmarchaeota archaeon]|nr:DUF1045 domain-containing protein [Candidatus Aenigmarchaeota archaeon]